MPLRGSVRAEDDQGAILALVRKRCVMDHPEHVHLAIGLREERKGDGLRQRQPQG